MSGVSARSSTPGVSVGQTAHYTLSGPDAADTVDSLFTVTSVQGTNVTFTDLDTSSDGTNTTDILWVDINIGPALPSSLKYFVVAPDLVVKDLIYPDASFYSGLTIQDVNPNGNYANAVRTIVHLQAQSTFQGQTTIEDFYWDQKTGMFTEIFKKLNGATQLHVVMDNTSMWPADNPFEAVNTANAILTIISAGLVAIVVVGGFVIWRRKRR